MFALFSNTFECDAIVKLIAASAITARKPILKRFII